MRRLVDPRMHADIEDMVPSRCTVYAVTITTSPAGQKVESLGSAVAGLSNVSCRISPIILIRPTDDEETTASNTQEIVGRQLKFNGYYPQITVRMRAVVDGRQYRIRGVEADGNLFSTRLKLEVLIN